MPKGLDAGARYSLKAYSGVVQSTNAPGEAKLQFPMVSKIAPLSDASIPASMSGSDLLNKGVTLKDGPGVIWISYRKAP